MSNKLFGKKNENDFENANSHPQSANNSTPPKLQRENKKQSSIIISPLNCNDFIAKIENWKLFLGSCYGPFGRSVMIQNSVCGPVIFSNSGSCILETIRPSHSILQLITATVKNHYRQWKNFGIFSSLMILEILQSSLKSSMPLVLASSAVELAGKCIIQHLTSDCSMCTIKADVKNLKHLLTVIITILKSKLRSSFTDVDIKYLATVCLEAFLSSVPNEEMETFGCTTYIIQEGLSLSKSRFCPGLLYVRSDSELELRNISSNVKIALFDISLAGDYENQSLNYVHESSELNLTEEITVAQVSLLIDQLVQLEVSIVACQKVIHPRIRKQLRARRILVVERLGKEHFSFLGQLSGGKPISSFFEKIEGCCLGILKDVDRININGKDYLHFQGYKTTIGSIVLCGCNEEILSNVKKCCEQALHALSLLLSYPKLYIGGGCLETHLITVLNNNLHSTKWDTDVFQEIFPILVDALKFAARTLNSHAEDFWIDMDSGHLFFSDDPEAVCACGLSTRRKPLCPLQLLRFAPRKSEASCDAENGNDLQFAVTESTNVADPTVAKLEAYKKFFEITSLLLRTGFSIIDSN